MSDQKNTPEDDDPVRKKLRSLPKSQAPWYFEARLQQRIRGGSKAQANWLTARPLPALALGVGVFLFVCLAGYYTVIVSPAKEQQILLPDSSESTITIPQPVPEPEKASSSLEQNGDLPAGNSGPNAPSPEATVESGIPIQTTQPATTSDSREFKQNPGAESVSGAKLKAGTSSKANIVQVDSSEKGVNDSMKSKPDTLKITK